MDGLKSYIFSIMIVSVTAAAINILAPEKGDIPKYMQFLLAIIISCVILLPVSSLLVTLPDIFNIEYTKELSCFDENELYPNKLVSETICIIENNISSEISKKFNTTPLLVNISCNTEDIDNIIIERIKIIFDKENKLMFSDIKKYIENIFECEVIVVADKQAKEQEN